MNDAEQMTQVDRNFQVFQELLPELLQTHPGEYVVMHDSRAIDFFDTFRDAVLFGHATYGDGRFSVQEITDQSVSFGFRTYAVAKHSD